jgi:hypothetical protein
VSTLCVAAYIHVAPVAACSLGLCCKLHQVLAVPVDSSRIATQGCWRLRPALLVFMTCCIMCSHAKIAAAIPK